jgi:uncharacterized protein (DUF927 family)
MSVQILDSVSNKYSINLHALVIVTVLNGSIYDNWYWFLLMQHNASDVHLLYFLYFLGAK